MATAFNDAQAWLTGEGNFSLGNAGKDDGAADATYNYAKGDIFVNVPLFQLWSSPNAPTLGRTSAGLYTAALTTNTTQFVVVPLSLGQLFRKFSGSSGTPSNPHGVKITDLIFAYTVATAGATSLAVAFFTEAQSNAVARAATATPFGAVTYQNPIGTVVANPPVATQATPYVVKAIPAAPVFINVDNTEAFAEITVVLPNTCVVTLTHIGFHASVALY